MRFTVCKAAALIQARHPKHRAAMIGLTYRDASTWRPNHIRDYLVRVRCWLRSEGLPMVPYAWVLEYQKRGAPHYHVLLYLPRGVKLPKPDQSGMWPHGSSSCLFARFAPGYIAKYISKDASKHHPPIPRARMYGVGGVHPDDKDQLRFEKLPTWVKDSARGTLAHDIHRAPAGGYVARSTGEYTASPWVRVGFDAGRPVLDYRPDRLTPFAEHG